MIQATFFVEAERTEGFPRRTLPLVLAGKFVQPAQYIGDVGGDVPFLFSVVDVRYFNQDGGLFHASEAGIDGCPEGFHGRGQAHVGIHQGRNVFP